MGCLKENKLVLFFTRDVSLKTWCDTGLLNREIKLYQAIGPHVRHITFVTYGNAKDLRYAGYLDGMRIICNRWNLSKRFYTFFLTGIYPLLWRGQTILKSNQMPGAEVALSTAKRFGIKFIARCGYLPSNIATWHYGAESPEEKQAQQREQTVFEGADCVAVTTAVMQRTLIQRYGIKQDKIRIIPNYVDTRLFKPSIDRRCSNLLCFLGRLEQEKNIQALFDAIEGLNVELMIIGSGNLLQKLKETALKKQLQVNFLGNLSNEQLPDVLNQASLFILPSHIEHHPKAMLEAMACGLAVIGSDVQGIRELIDHRRTGYLCDTSAHALREAIKEVLADPVLCRRMGDNARDFIVNNFELGQIAVKELALLEEMAS